MIYIDKCKVESFVTNINKANSSYNTKVERLNEKISLWESKDDSYSIKFESIKEIEKENGEENGD